MNPYIITENTISCIINGKSYIVDKTHVNFSLIKEAVLTESWNRVVKLVDIKRTIVRFSRGAFSVRDDGIYWGEEVVHNVVCDRIMKFMQDGQDFKPLLAFLERLYNNVSKHSIDQLYSFLEHKNLPIDKDGYFYAYKAITNDWMDKHTRSVSNMVGQQPIMLRAKVQDDANIHCSHGYHVGSIEYVRGFASRYGDEGGDRIVIVKVDPAHVVSVPNDCNCQKVRVTSYLVVEEYQGLLPETVYPKTEVDDKLYGYVDGDLDWEDEDNWDYDDDIEDDDDDIDDNEEDEQDNLDQDYCPSCGNHTVEDEECTWCGWIEGDYNIDDDSVDQGADFDWDEEVEEQEQIRNEQAATIWNGAVVEDKDKEDIPF